MSIDNVNFEYKPVKLKNIVVHSEQGKYGPKINSVSLDGLPTKPTQRFWTSIFAKYGFNNQFFRYFDYGEVFNRIAERAGSDEVRVCVEHPEGRESKALAAIGMDKPVLPFDEMTGLIKSYGGEKLEYANGVLSSSHTPRFGGGEFEIAGDSFCNRFALNTPIDGFGDPAIYLSLLRQVCTNGAIGFAKAFKSQVKIGKGENHVFALTKAMEGFSNDEGFAAIRQRFESAAMSWASVYETTQLYKTLAKVINGGFLVGGDSPFTRKWADDEAVGENYTKEELPILKAFHRMSGDIALTYGISNVDALTAKRQKTLPVKCTVYDALNFATEVATHHTDTMGNRIMQAWVGGTISAEFDMEGTKEQFGEFKDFHIDRTALAAAAAN
jgi:hypothetical protein